MAIKYGAKCVRQRWWGRQRRPGGAGGDGGMGALQSQAESQTALLGAGSQRRTPQRTQLTLSLIKTVIGWVFSVSRSAMLASGLSFVATGDNGHPNARSCWPRFSRSVRADNARPPARRMPPGPRSRHGRSHHRPGSSGKSGYRPGAYRMQDHQTRHGTQLIGCLLVARWETGLRPAVRHPRRVWYP